MTDGDAKVRRALEHVEAARDRLLADAQALSANADALVHVDGAAYIVAKLQQAARDLTLTANSLPALGLRRE